MLRIVITAFSWEDAHSAHCCLLSYSYTSSEKELVFYFLLANFGLKRGDQVSYLRFPMVLNYLGDILPSYFSHRFPLVLLDDDMWDHAGLYLCSGPWLPIHQPFILLKWNKVTSGSLLPAESKCLPAAQHTHPPIRPCSLDLFSSATQLRVPAPATTGCPVPFPVLHMMSETHGFRT